MPDRLTAFKRGPVRKGAEIPPAYVWESDSLGMDSTEVIGILGRSVQTVWDEKKISFRIPSGTQGDWRKPMVDVFKWRDPFNVKRKSRPSDAEGTSRRHLGIDFVTTEGEQFNNVDAKRGEKTCHAIAAGEIILSKRVFLYGNVIIIDHGGGVASWYAHLLSDTSLPAGTTVEAGQQIAVTGRSELAPDGWREDGVRNPHLHFELRIAKSLVDAGEGEFPSVDKMREELKNNRSSYSIDPIPLLINAPWPLLPEELSSPFVRHALAAEVAEYELLISTFGAAAELDPIRLNVEASYPRAAALARAAAMDDLSREDYYTEAARAVIDRAP